MNKVQIAGLLADFDDPRLTQLDLCERHALTPDALFAIAALPPSSPPAHVCFRAQFRVHTPNPP